MTMVQIRDVPEDVVATLKARAAADRMSLSDFLKGHLEEIARQPRMGDVLARLASRPRRELSIPITELLDEVRGE